MSVKKITAPSMAEAMKRVKVELGEEAVILSSKVITNGGFLGLFKKKQFEVMAVTDSPSVPPKREAFPEPPIATGHDNRSAGFEQELMSQLAEVKEMLTNQKKEAGPSVSVYPQAIQPFISRMESQEVNEAIIGKIGGELLEIWSTSTAEPDERELRLEAKIMLNSMLENINFNWSIYNKKFITLAGPTGVGKTTTLAKLAARAALDDKKKVAFMTMDTYRIAAIDQLKTYAGLLDVPVEVIYEPEDFAKAAVKFQEYDHVFIDTAGRNFRESAFVHALAEYLPAEKNELEILLVLPVSLKESDLNKMMDNFSQLSIGGLIFTKMDETAAYGPMVNAMVQYNLPVAYVTNGQDVPDDIRKADSGLFAQLIFGDGAK